MWEVQELQWSTLAWPIGNESEKEGRRVIKINRVSVRKRMDRKAAEMLVLKMNLN